MFEDKIYKPRYCTPEDFGETEEGDTIYKSWAGITILCPDIPKNVDTSLMGDLSSMISNR